MKKTFVLLALIAFTTALSAQTVPETDSGLEEFKEVYNNQSEEVPGFVGDIIGGETVNINLQGNETNETIGAKFDGVTIENISEERYSDYTLEVNVTETAISSVSDAEQPYQELRNQLDEENIEYETTTVSAGIKIKIFETLGNLASMIGLSF